MSFFTSSKESKGLTAPSQSRLPEKEGAMALAWQGQEEKADIRKNTASKQCAQTRAGVTDNTNTTNNLVSPSKQELSQTRT